MINNFILLKEGGLFDFDLTLPFIVLEFLFLSFLLNKIFFIPLQEVIEKRKKYINKLSNEINFLLKQSELLVSLAENLVLQEKRILNNDNFHFNQMCDSKFEIFLKNISEWNFTQIQKSEILLTYQISSIFKFIPKNLRITEEKLYKFLIH
jgi:hypothetical protein